MIDSNKKLLFSILTAITLLFLVLFMKAGFLALFLIFITILTVFFSYKPELGVYLMAFVLPLIYVLVDLPIANSKVPLIDALALIVFLAYILRVVFINVFTIKKEKINFPVLIPFLIFFLATLLTSLLLDNPFTSLWFSIRYILGFYLFYIVLPFNVLKDSFCKIKMCLSAFVASSFLFSISSVLFFIYDLPSEFFRFKPINYIWQDKIINFFTENFSGLIEVYPFITEHTLFVETLLPALFLALALKAIVKKERTKRAMNLIIGFIFIVLIGTFSRGAWLSLALCFLLFVIYKVFFQRKNLRVYILIGFIFIALAFPIFSHMYKLQTSRNIGESSNSNRILSIKIAYNAFKEKKFFGHGGGEYVDIVAENKKYIIMFGNPVDALGVWQKVLVEYGILGVITFSIFVSSIFTVFVRALKEFRKKENFLIPMVLASVGIFFFEFFNTSYYTGKLWFPIGITLAMIYLIKKKKYAE